MLEPHSGQAGWGAWGRKGCHNGHGRTFKESTGQTWEGPEMGLGDTVSLGGAMDMMNGLTTRPGGPVSVVLLLSSG